MNKLQEHISSIGKRFHEKFAKISEISRGEYVISDITGSKFQAVVDDTGKVIDAGSLSAIKSHILASQITTIELIKEEVEGRRKKRLLGDTKSPSQDSEWIGYNSALSFVSSLLDSVLKELKK